MLLSFRTVARGRMRRRIELGTSEIRLQTLGVFFLGGIEICTNPLSDMLTEYPIFLTCSLTQIKHRTWLGYWRRKRGESLHARLVLAVFGL